MQNTGRVLLIIGLAALVVVILFFLATLIYVCTSATYRVPASTLRPIYLGLYLTVGLLIIRNVFRLIEFGQGWHGYIARHEVYFYVFDALVILVWLLVVLPLHFGLLLRPARVQLAKLADESAIPANGNGNGILGYSPTGAKVSPSTLV